MQNVSVNTAPDLIKVLLQNCTGVTPTQRDNNNNKPQVYKMSAGEFSTGVKRRKFEQKALLETNKIFHDFYNVYEQYSEFIIAFKQLLEGREQCLLPTVIDECDASSTNPFHDCRCIATPDTDIPLHFGAFFLNGVRIYNDLVERKIPDDENLRKVTKMLLEYVMNLDCHEELKKIEDREYVKGESQLMVTLAEHYFSKLSFPQGYVMGNHANKMDISKCGTCNKEKLRFDDTSIGDQRVWHGCLDILFDSCEVPVMIQNKVEANVENEGEDRDEINIENIDNVKPRSQILAQTIVFSMLQKRRHPDSRHFLIPSIIANTNCVKFFFYDGKNDILLESKSFPFLWQSTTSKMPCSLVFETVIASWLVLNYKILCTGLYEECLIKAPKSRFKELADSVIDIYEDELQFRNVKKTAQARTFDQWERFRYLPSFDWPSSLSVKPK